MFDKFKEPGLNRLPVLLGLYTDEDFTIRRLKGGAAVDNNVGRNIGKDIRQYVNLYKPESRKRYFIPICSWPIYESSC